MSSACDQYEERTYGPGHLGRKFAEQIPGREGSEPNRGSLACVGNIVEAARKIGIAAPTKFESAGMGRPESERSTKLKRSA
jgi:hypothetical protein